MPPVLVETIHKAIDFEPGYQANTPTYDPELRLWQIIYRCVDGTIGTVNIKGDEL